MKANWLQSRFQFEEAEDLSCPVQYKQTLRQKVKAAKLSSGDEGCWWTTSDRQDNECQDVTPSGMEEPLHAQRNPTARRDEPVSLVGHHYYILLKEKSNQLRYGLEGVLFFKI